MPKIKSTIWRTKADDRNLLTLEGDLIIVPMHLVTLTELKELGQAIAELLAAVSAPHPS